MPDSRSHNIYNQRFSKWLFLAAIILLAPALLINLGLLTFIDDEAIRSLVALEMKLSGNYITPTLNGEFYYNKPPLYNWFILLFFNIMSNISEFTARIPTLVCLLGYAATIFYYFKKHYDTKIAFLNAFFLITCGRILFYDSMLGLIDIGFSWVIFTSFMVIYHQYQKQNSWALFLISYLLTALAFLMKGLPAVVFQGFTLLAFFIYQKQVRKLFSIQHIIGGLLFILIVSGYYLIYNEYNSLSNVFTTLFSESSKRTVVNFGIWKTILHLFTFPFEMIYHFLPWALMIVYFIRKDIVKLILQDKFITYNLLIFIANLLVYWTSVEVYPRYLLMHAPLIFSVYIYLHYIHKKENSFTFKILDKIYFGVLLIIMLGSFAPLFMAQTQGISHLYLKSLSISAALVFLVSLYWKLPNERLTLMVVFLLVFRIGFNWFVLPDRNANDFGDVCRQTSREVGQKFAGQKLYLYKETKLQTTNSFYITNERKEILRNQVENFDSNAVYIIDPDLYPNLNYEKLAEIKLRHDTLTFDIGRLK
ncbi:MAG: glycosyltransferase family 39 protein [Saprospiraceae bacterium]|nr:glycosyltransferase family 39 protein [Saprospiraceae bacterium]